MAGQLVRQLLGCWQIAALARRGRSARTRSDPRRRCWAQTFGRRRVVGWRWAVEPTKYDPGDNARGRPWIRAASDGGRSRPPDWTRGEGWADGKRRAEGE